MAIDADVALVTKVITTTAISTLISTRMHPLRLPDTPTFPCVTYSQIDAPIVSTHDQTSANALTHARYQIDAFAATYAGAVALGKAIFDALEGFAGVVTKGADTFNFQACLRVDKRASNDSETGLWWISQDFTLWFVQ